MVKNATKAEPMKPVKIINKSFNSNKYAPFNNINAKAPKMVGMLNKNANFEVSFKFKPIINAPVIAIPDLEAPGKIANAWKQPINKAAVRVNSVKDFDWVEILKTAYNKTANKRFVHAIEFVFENLYSVKSEKNNPTIIIGRVATKRFNASK